MSHAFLNELQVAHQLGTFSTFIRSTAKTGELFEIFPPLKILSSIPQDPRWHPEGDVWTHTLLVIEYLPENATFAMALSALFHDVGKRDTTVIRDDGRITAYGHENSSKKIAQELLNKINAPEKLKKDVLFLIYRHMLAHSKDTNIKTLTKLVLEGGYDLVNQLLLHGVADVKGGSSDFTECIRLRKLFDGMDHLIPK